MFTWSLADLFAPLFYFFSYYFLYTFLTGRDLPILQKLIGIAAILPIATWIFLGQKLTTYDANLCEAYENTAFNNYQFFVEGLFLLAVVVLAVVLYRRAKDALLKKEIILTTTGVFIFLGFFLSGTLGVNFLVSDTAVQFAYNFEIYGLFGMPILLIYLGYLIVRYKAFDLKIFGAQALIFALVALIGSEFVFISSLTSQILVAITLVFVGVIGILLIRSVKKEIQQREELAVANRGQENLIHVMNHQVKGFITTAKNIFAELLQSNDYGQMPEQSKPLLSHGFDKMNEAVDFVQSILKGRSAQSGALPYDMKQIDLKPIVSTLTSEQRDVAEKKGLSFESHIANGDYATVGDATLLEEAFKNLITNAIKYNSPNGSIKVNMSRTDGKILFSVKDTGVGISKEDEPRLFKPGGMGINSMKQNADASGFGLALVKPVVEKHQGKVWYETQVGKGTTFFVELPVISAAPIKA
jgi:signal transduction histidine kinase